jgi:raffinose/stachyose/melibiose transport system substrate-binding protein
MSDRLGSPLTRSRLLRLGAGGAAALGLAPLIAACGDDDDEGGETTAAAPPTTAAEATTAAPATSAAETGAATTGEAATTAALPTNLEGGEIWWWGETEAAGIQGWLEDTMAKFQEATGAEMDATLMDTAVVVPQFTEAAAAGAVPDVQFLFNGIYHMENVWLGYLDPLDGVLAPSTIENGGGTVMSRFQGKNYRTGFYSLGLCVAYNKELFSAAGLDPEAPPTTWDDFLAACEALKADGVIPIGVGVKDGFFGEWYFGQALAQNLDTPADALNLFIGELDFRDAKYHDHWIKLQELRDKEYINEDSTSLELYQGIQLFDTGKAAMCLNVTPALPNSATQIGADKLGAMVLPTFGTGAMAGKPITDTQGWGIPSKAEQKETAAAFIDYMHTPDRLAAMWTMAKQIPANTSFDSSIIDDPFIKGVYDTWIAGERNVYIPDLMPTLFWTDAMFVASQKILAGEMTGAEAGELAAEVTERWKQQNPDKVEQYTLWSQDLASA